MTVRIIWLAPALAGLLLPLAAGRANARSIADCEKIEQWDAYNKCLASFGPKRGHSVVVRENGPNGEAAAPPTVRRGGVRRAGPGFIRRGKGGRQFAIFEVGGSAPRAGRIRRR